MLFKKNKAKTKKELWALSLSAPLFQINGNRHDYLYGGRLKSWMAKHYGFLDRDWSIHNSDDLKDTLKWLESSGHRDGFMEALLFLTSLSEEGAANYIDSCRANREKYEQFKIVNYYKLPLAKVGITAWDIQRYVFLCRTGTTIGLMDENEAWDLILKMALNSQKIFSGWPEYALSYFAGRQYWLGNSTVDFAQEMRKIIKQLLVHEDGIWHDLDWDTCLE